MKAYCLCDLLKIVFSVGTFCVASSYIHELHPGKLVDPGEGNLVSQHLVPGYTGVVMDARTFRFNPVQMTPRCGGYIILHALCVAVACVLHAMVRLLVQIDLLNNLEGAPYLCFSGNIDGLCLSYIFHFHAWPELTFLMEVYFKPFGVISNIALIHSS